jgi:hypothetical protein
MPGAGSIGVVTRRILAETAFLQDSGETVLSQVLPRVEQDQEHEHEAHARRGVRVDLRAPECEAEEEERDGDASDRQDEEQPLAADRPLSETNLFGREAQRLRR